eukprot:COSAG06_NODE_19758_length_823_cov_1.523481_1_plen_87_part_01
MTAQKRRRTKLFDVRLGQMLQIARHGIPERSTLLSKHCMHATHKRFAAGQISSRYAHASDSDHRISVVEQAKALEVLSHFSIHSWAQ